MIPVGPIAYFLVRGLRGGVARKTDARLANALLRMLALLLAILPIAILADRLHAWALPIAVLLVALLLPALTLRTVLLPLGLSRAAYWFAILSPPIAHSAEIRGGAVLVGALALGRRAVDPAKVAWLEAKLARAFTSRSLTMAAAGLLAAARGQKETTRLLFHSLDGVSSRSPRIARRVARSWLVADAASRGDWKEVVVLGRGGRSYVRWPYSMGTIAQRLMRDPRASSDPVLWLAWIAAPHRLATLPLLRRALALPRMKGAPSAAPIAAPPETTDPLDGPLRAHAVCLCDPTEATLVTAGHAWDAARASSAVRAALARRALSLETKTTPEAALSALFATAEADLAPLLEGMPAALLATSGTLGAASDHARRRTMDEIELRAEAMAQRTARRAPLHVSGEWMEWGALRRLCDRVIRDAPDAVRRATFATVYGPACNYGAWLFNVRGEKLLANGIFRWLADEARFANDAAAIKVLEKNVKAGDGV